eukprot:365329-Chlamydomonas_euryale.AAC.16
MCARQALRCPALRSPQNSARPAVQGKCVTSHTQQPRLCASSHAKAMVTAPWRPGPEAPARRPPGPRPRLGRPPLGAPQPLALRPWARPPP